MYVALADVWQMWHYPSYTCEHVYMYIKISILSYDAFQGTCINTGPDSTRA